MRDRTGGAQAQSQRALVVAALGIVFGDIATSPLYAMRESLVGGHEVGVTPDSVRGVLSLVVWSLVVIIAIKYVILVMRADHDGEGGILALTTLIDRQRLGRTGAWLSLLGLFGTALLYGDGAITPAISVLSAVEGLAVATPALDAWVVPIAIAILVGLFAVQPWGTARIGAVFGPVMGLWFLVLAVLGLRQVLATPEVLTAVDPRHAVAYFADHGFAAFRSLGAVFLVVTGGEALYADMGHVGARAIRRGWFLVAMPSLLLAYLGQGALLLSDPTAVDSPLFRMGPTWATMPLVVLATAATVIASQALISGAFSLTMQAVQVDHLPRVTIRRTSREHAGQVYVPVVNWLLLAACVALVATFRTSSNLAAAYGVAVTATMAITTVLFAVVAVHRLGWSRRRATVVGCAFLVVDLAFLGANLLKVPDGGWFPLVVASAILALMVTWRSGRLDLARARRKELVPVRKVVASAVATGIPRVPGTAFYLHPRLGQTPPALLANLRANHVLHQQIVILTVSPQPVPRVPRARQVRTQEMGDGVLALEIRFGFAQRPSVTRALRDHDDPIFDLDDSVFVLGREHVEPAASTGVLQRLRQRLFIRMHRNAADAAAYYGLPPTRVIEVGRVVTLPSSS